MHSDSSGYLDRIRALIDQPPLPTPTESPVDPTLIKLWCEAVDDANPIYSSEAAAVRSPHGHLVAPPAMLMVWDMPGMRLKRGEPWTDLRADLLNALAAAGYTKSIVVEAERRFIRYLQPGERLWSTTVIEKVGERKVTALGDGHFVTWRTDVLDADHQVVGWLRLTLFNYLPAPLSTESASS